MIERFDPADEVAIVLRDPIERAVPQDDHAAVLRERLEPVVGQDRQWQPRPAWPVTAASRPARAPREPSETPYVAGGALEGRRARRRAEPFRLERDREQARDHVVAPLREADLELLIRSAVQLRRTSGTRPCPAREPPILGAEQPGLDQAIEVERGQRASDPDR